MNIGLSIWMRRYLANIRATSLTNGINNYSPLFLSSRTSLTWRFVTTWHRPISKFALKILHRADVATKHSRT